MVVAAIYNNLWSWYSNETVVRAGGVRHVQGKRIRGFSMGYLSLAIPRGRNFWTTNVTTPDEWFRLRCRANQKLVVCCWLRSVNDHQGSQAPTTENCLFYNDFPRIFTNRPEPSRVQQLRTLWLYNLRCSTLTLQNRHNDFKRPFQFAPLYQVSSMRSAATLSDFEHESWWPQRAKRQKKTVQWKRELVELTRWWLLMFSRGIENLKPISLADIIWT